MEQSAKGKTCCNLRIVVGAGNTQTRTNYGLADLRPLPGASYYRLRLFYFDGPNTYLPVCTAALTAEAAASARRLVFTNPLTAQCACC